MDTGQTTLNDETTEQLGPGKKSCWFCIPRRLGIIVLGLIKLVLSFGLFVILFDVLFLSRELSYLIWFYHIVSLIAITLDVVDVIIAMVLILSVCMENRRFMKMYYVYSICVFGSIAVLCCVVVFISTLDIVVLLIFLFIIFLVFSSENQHYYPKNIHLPEENCRQSGGEKEKACSFPDTNSSYDCLTYDLQFKTESGGQ